MSQAEIKKFYLSVVQDPALKEQLFTAPDRHSLVTTAVKLGDEKGYSFTEQDVENWLTASAEQSRPAGLSDTDLEVTAGGKGAEEASHAGEVATGVTTPTAPVPVATAAITCAPHQDAHSISPYAGAAAIC
jgi:predicted ribosomally synthesized peptide with nif11-like leader